MVLRVMSPFSFQGKSSGMESNSKSSSRGYSHAISNKNSVSDGLRILIEISNKDSNNVLVKSSLRSQKSRPLEDCCLLKACHLCNKKLSHDKDVYMGEGFCRVECRERQIFIDEMNEVGTSTKRVRTSHRRCGDDQSETRALLKELQHRRQLLNSQKNRAIFSYS